MPPCTLPLTLKLANVPVLVMFGCAAVVTVPAVVALVALPTAPLTLLPATLLAVVAYATAPFTLAPLMYVILLPLPLKLPAPCITKLFALIVPVMLAPPMPSIRPVTLRLTNVPVLVIFGCAAVVTVPAVVALDTVPVTLPPVILVNVLPLPIK